MLPIQVIASGSYAEAGRFISALGALPRPILVEDFTIVPDQMHPNAKAGQSILSLDMGLLAYRLALGVAS